MKDPQPVVNQNDAEVKDGSARQRIDKKRETVPNPEIIKRELLVDQPLSDEKKRELLQPEILSDLSIEEYIALWRRINPYFLSHAVRQGFRDHNGMIYHSSGMREFHRGLLNILEDDKKMRSPLAAHGLRYRDDESVKAYLHKRRVLQEKNEEGAKQKLRELLDFSPASAPNYPDITAVHFAAQLVADEYYGGEGNNEIFFIYPSDVLASQYDFALSGEDFTNKIKGETKWNDVFIWPSTFDNPGIPIDAGIVFLPESTPVDPNTGSKYASEVKNVDGKEKRVMIEGTALVKSFVKWAKRTLEDKQSPVNKAAEEWLNAPRRDEDEKERICLDIFSQELQDLGFAQDAAESLGRYMKQSFRFLRSMNLEALVKDTGAHYKRATNTIPAKQYWEDFFTQHPHLRPKHIYYYHGDPTDAVHEFLQKNNIGENDTSKKEGTLLGFDDHSVSLNRKPGGWSDERQDERAMRGYKELRETANRIIAEYYNGKRRKN